MPRLDLLCLTLLSGLLLACGSGALDVSPPAGPVSGELTVFAASSLSDAFKEIGQRFQAANPDCRILFNFGASSQLRTQLEQGAPADLFASANQVEIDRAAAAGLVAGEPRIFARNRLVVIFPRENPGQIAELRDLAQPGLRLVTAAPEVPIGLYSQDMLQRMSGEPAFGADFQERVNANIVSREANVRLIVARVSLGEADAAVVYSSDVTADLALGLGTLSVPDAFNTVATYPVAQLKSARQPIAAAAFQRYLLSPDAQLILRRWGFISGD